ncbi:MAG: ATP-dependent DNA ligase [Thiotrichaceae bacterium]|nr:ATP-dependent DNA ligase [Thiotrichaceae bacterium]
MNNNAVSKAIHYKKIVASRYLAIESESIRKKLSVFSKYLISIKYDGHFYALDYSNKIATLINRNGKIIDRTPLHEEIEAYLQEKKIDHLFAAGELYFSDDSQKRTRHFNVAKALANQGAGLKFAVFDILEKNETEYLMENAFERMDLIKEIIPSTGNMHYVSHQITESLHEVSEYYKEQVEINEHEGIVVKTEGFTTFKVKPKFTFDAVIVGFAQSDGERSNLLRDFLLAFRKDDGSYQIFAHLSHGFSDEQREKLLTEYKEKVVPSDFTEVARNKLGFQMVKPETVVEFSCLDVINQDSKGDINKMNLNYDDDNGYTANYHQATVSATIPVFLRFREDKQASIEDTHFKQVLDVVSFDDISTNDQADKAKTEIIKRQVYTKESRGSLMIKKLLLLKTNKEGHDDYPAYVLHVTDFSSGRKDPLKKEVLVTNSKEQIHELYDAALAKHIKKGWEEIIAN